MSNFWSRRRAAVEEEERTEATVAEAASRGGQDAERKSDEELLEELGLPDPDTMDAGSDFRAFLSDAVPARLRSRALRQLWRVNPALANLDGLLDYGEDFTDAATVVENMQTAYQVGKGMLRHLQAVAKQAADEAASDDAPPDACVTADDDGSAPAIQDTAATNEPTQVAAATYESFIDDAPVAVTAPRRMQFEFSSEMGSA